MKHLSQTDPALCVAFLFPEARRADFDVRTLVPPALLAEDIAALTELIKQAIRAPDARQVDKLDQELAAVVARISTSLPNARAVFDGPHRYFDDPRVVCDVLLAYYTDIINLPPARAGPLLRSLVEPQP